MRFPTPLVPARLIRRYKRFLADCSLEGTGERITAHCPNPGSMIGLQDDGMRIWLEPNDDPKKKLKYGWRVAELPGGHFAGIDTSVPNRVVKEAFLARSVPELAHYQTVRPEVRYGTNSRVDFLLTQQGEPDAYVEVKNVHLQRSGDWAEFPDSVTSRGAKHLRELGYVVAQGHRAFMFYLVQRTDCARFRLAKDIDPEYAAAFEAARSKGVEVLCYDTDVSPHGVTLRDRLPITE